MATESELLIWGYNRLEQEIQAKLEEIKTLREMQRQTKEKMPRLYFVEGYGGVRGLAERVHCAGTHEECKKWLSYNRYMILLPDGEQIVHKDTPNVGSPPLAGRICSVTPVDERWHEISALKEGE